MPKSISDLVGDEVIAKGGAKVSTSSFTGEGQVIGLYFSAHWCPPCKAFTPVLAKWYNNFKASASGDKLEIVFVSSDQGDASFNAYFAEMPWLALPWADSDRKAQMAKEFDVTGIPTLVFLDHDGNVITTKGRSFVEENSNATSLPTK